jgi:RNA polymerase sigma-70 factor (ECF subfamily)
MNPPAPDPSAFGRDVEAWIREARAGAPAALGQVLDPFRQYLLLVANQELPGELHAKLGPSDLVQQTFLEAQRGFGRFRGASEEELRAWLRRILLNLVANARRHYLGTDKRDVRREVPLDPGADAAAEVPSPGADTDSPSALTRAEEDADQLRRALDGLSETARQVVRWRNYERCSFEEIGRRLGRSAEAARKVWVRAIERLRQLMDLPDEPR